MAYKVFTNGSVLQASEINDNLMRQSVMVFSNASARTAAITSPVEGMLTWLEDVNRYESYNGTAWVSPYGLTQLINTNFSASTAVAVDNVFTSQYENYRVILKVDAMSAANSVTVNMNYRKAGVTQTSAVYRAGSWFFSIDGGTSGIFYRNNGGTNVWFGNAGVPSTPSVWTLDVFSPNVATSTTPHIIHGMSHYNGTSAANSSNVPYWGAGSYTTADNFDGLIITPGSGNMTGNIKIYGYRN